MLCFMMIANTLVTMNINIAIVEMVNFAEDSESTDNLDKITCPNTTFFLRDFLVVDYEEEISPKSEVRGNLVFIMLKTLIVCCNPEARGCCRCENESKSSFSIILR